MLRKLRVVVLMGGRSPEHEISLLSGREVVRQLDPQKYEVLPVVISRDGTNWPLGVSELVAKKPDIAFIAMHGRFGEDGTIQGVLEILGIAYTGPGVLTSALGMDKLRFREILEACKILFPQYVSLTKDESSTKVYKTLGEPPYFVKPNSQGSSVGCSLVRNKKDLRKALSLAFCYDDLVLVDEYVKGIEVTAAILGNKKPEALPLVEISPQKNDFFSYECKYSEGGAEEIVPARISENLGQKVHEIAKKVYRAVGASGFSRVDFILKDGKIPLVLEINTIPGLTPMSLFPKAAEAAGISYPELLDRIIMYAYEK